MGPKVKWSRIARTDEPTQFCKISFACKSDRNSGTAAAPWCLNGRWLVFFLNKKHVFIAFKGVVYT
jgi:hypothetical protein